MSTTLAEPKAPVTSDTPSAICLFCGVFLPAFPGAPLVPAACSHVICPECQVAATPHYELCVAIVRADRDQLTRIQLFSLPAVVDTEQRHSLRRMIQARHTKLNVHRTEP